MKKMTYSIFLFFIVILVYQSCTYERVKIESGITDEKLFSMIGSSSFTFYQSSNDTLSAAGNSPHGIFRLLFNKKAVTALDGTGKLPVGASFPDSSLIVKEIYTNKGGPLVVYAILYKDSKSPYATNGWNWAEINPNGSSAYSVYKKGEGCVGCHGGGTNRDYIRSFDLH